MRRVPELAVRMQAGLFGDRTGGMKSVESTFISCMNQDDDFRELIPEFYSESTDFYSNIESLDLGLEEPTLDVELPLWARDSTHFSELMRDALESDYVSSSLHQWIDLVFGCRQRGDAATQCCNDFADTTYFDSAAIKSFGNEYERNAMKVLVREFGQCPLQLFAEPHPVREFRWTVQLPPELPSQDCTVRLKIKIEQLQNQAKALEAQYTRELKELEEEANEEVEGIKASHIVAVAKYREKLAVWEARRSEREMVLTKGFRRNGSLGGGESTAGKLSMREFGKMRTFDSILAPIPQGKDSTISLYQRRQKSSTELPVSATQTPLSTSRFKTSRVPLTSTPPDLRPISLAHRLK